MTVTVQRIIIAVHRKRIAIHVGDRVRLWN